MEAQQQEQISHDLHANWAYRAYAFHLTSCIFFLSRYWTEHTEICRHIVHAQWVYSFLFSLLRLNKFAVSNSSGSWAEWKHQLWLKWLLGESRRLKSDVTWWHICRRDSSAAHSRADIHFLGKIYNTIQLSAWHNNFGLVFVILNIKRSCHLNNLDNEILCWWRAV